TSRPSTIAGLAGSAAIACQSTTEAPSQADRHTSAPVASTPVPPAAACRRPREPARSRDHEREGRDQRENDERARTRLREHHHPEQDRDEAGDREQCPVGTVEREPEGRPG